MKKAAKKRSAIRKKRAKKKIAKKKRATRKKTEHLKYLEDVEPINEKTSNGSHLEEMYDRTISMPEFALLSEDGRQIGSWMKCKDYIQDCIWGGKFGKSYNCHGFEYNHGQDPQPNLKNLHLALRYPNSKAKLSVMLENVKSTVEDMERRVGIPKEGRTRFSRVIKDYFVVYGSSHWLKATHTISFFTFLLRASFMNKGGKIDTIGKTSPVKKDIYYYKNGRKYMDMLSKSGIKEVKGNWDNHKNHNDSFSVHNDGFVNWSINNGQKTVVNLEEEDDWSF